jgi:hypothetical protein
MVYDADSPGTTWQAQVRAGLAGRLEGFTLELNATQGAGTLIVALRLGPGWNTTPIVFQRTISTPGSGIHDVFVDATSAGIQLTPGTLFVIEMQSQNTGTYLDGSYVDPSYGPALYPEPLFENGPGCWFDCGGRIGFKTYVVQGPPPAAYCFGDGTSAACPCGNAGASGHGCASSVSANGAQLAGSGLASVAADSFVLSGSDMPDSFVLYFQGTLKLNGGVGAVFGDGLRCVAGTIRRLGTKTNSGGASQYPGASDAPISVRGALPPGGGTREYQAWYRNAAAFCTGSTFNLSNGLEVTWIP